MDEAHISGLMFLIGVLGAVVIFVWFFLHP